MRLGGKGEKKKSLNYQAFPRPINGSKEAHTGFKLGNFHNRISLGGKKDYKRAFYTTPLII